MDIKKLEETNIKTDSPKSALASINWVAPEYEYIPKSNNWFWSVGIVTGSIAFASILLGNSLFAILVLIAGFTIILYGTRKPRKVEFSVNPKGIKIGDRLFAFENLQSFWIYYDPPYRKYVAVEPKKILMPIISIPLADTNPNIIREYLVKFLKEERREESFVATITRFLGF